MTSWTLDYILDSTTLSQLMMIHKFGIEWEETKSIIFLNKYAELMSGKSKKQISDKPDLKKFSAIYGSKIKTKKKE